LSRVYEAVVHGRMKEPAGRVDMPVGRHPTDRKRQSVNSKTPRQAVTDYETITGYRGYTHIRCRLHTGRTHQIRVHMAAIGHPLLGDMVYGHKKPELGLEGQCLHARQLKFIHPSSGEPVELSSDLPDYFKDVLAKLEKIGRLDSEDL
ncbi:MAG: RluA family pseudouridine synthase, partial [Oscillospiraceae bacterium]|nr:RluA family pseudouridine synthase [Oscillospiraceae bacterium]